MSQLPVLYKKVYKLDKVKPVNLRFIVDERKPLHPFADKGRLREFARRNRKSLHRVYNELYKGCAVLTVKGV